MCLLKKIGVDLFRKIFFINICVNCLKQFDITQVYYNSFFPFKLLMRMLDGNHHKLNINIISEFPQLNRKSQLAQW